MLIICLYVCEYINGQIYFIMCCYVVSMYLELFMCPYPLKVLA